MNSAYNCIYVTEDKSILENKTWLELDMLGVGTVILSAQEAATFLDLFLKYKQIFIIRTSQASKIDEIEFAKPNWYWCSMRLKLPHYNQGDEILDSLSIRFIHFLLAVDELGIRFHSPFDTGKAP